MTIDDDHMYHGSALIQIAEHAAFTAINSLRTSAGLLRNSYRINQDIGLYIKYASKPTKPFREYPFTFTQVHLEELEAISSVSLRVFIALVCVKDRQICCLKYQQVLDLVGARRRSKGEDENQYAIMATLPKNKAFRVYANAAGARKKSVGQIIVARNRFPDELFE